MVRRLPIEFVEVILIIGSLQPIIRKATKFIVIERLIKPQEVNSGPVATRSKSSTSLVAEQFESSTKVVRSFPNLDS